VREPTAHAHAALGTARLARACLLRSRLSISSPCFPTALVLCRSGGWAKRYFYVDETRGTLSYAKSVMSVTKKVTPSAVLPLADVTSIEALDDDPCTFVIKCPPIHLTVAAVSPKEAKVWMTQLELRAQVWREKQNAKQPVATAEMLQAMLRRPASGAGSSVRSEADGESSTTPSLLSSRDVSHEPSRAASPEGDAGHSVGADPLQPRPARATRERRGRRSATPPATTEELGAEGLGLPKAPSAEDTGAGLALGSPMLELPHAPAADEAQELDREIAEAVAEGRAPASWAVPCAHALPQPVVVPCEIEAEAKATPVAAPGSKRAAQRAAAAAAAAAASPVDAVQTVEWDSGDEDVEPDRVNSANRADGPRASPPMRSAAPVPLSQIIANDDDDDDEAQEVDIVREAEEARERVRQQSARQRAERAPPTLAVEDESAEAQGAAPDEVAGRLPSPSVDRWDDGDDDWGDEEEDPRTAPAAPVSPRVVSGVLSAPGIVADENFAEDNWDNDEE
jgi:hypothetical protein